MPASLLDGHVVLARRLPHSRFRRIDTISPRNHIHHFCLLSPTEVDAEFISWLREAYAVGAQEHLKSPRGTWAASSRAPMITGEKLDEPRE